MTIKARHIDFYSDEYLAGTRGLTIDQLAIYDLVWAQCYSRGGRCPNDVEFLAGHFGTKGTHRQGKASNARRVAAALADLIAMGKLTVSADGASLSNGRADRELSKTSERIVGATRAGIASGQARRARALATGRSTERQRSINSKSRGAELNNSNDLSRTTVRNHQPYESSSSKISTDPARDPAPDRGAPGRARSPGEELAEKPTPPDQPETKATLSTLALAARKRLMGSG